MTVAKEIKKKRKPKKRVCNFSKEKVLRAIKGSAGIVSEVAKKLNCDWKTAHKYIHKYDETRLALENEGEELIDNAEMAMHNLISEGDGMMIRYYLSTKGRKRGYVERQEIEQSVTGKQIIKISYVDENET